MGSKAKEQQSGSGILCRPATGTALGVASGLSFFIMCMSLPLVGPAGSRVEHAAQNRAAFVGVLLVTLLLAAASAWSKMGRRRTDHSPLPLFSFGLCALCFLTLGVLLMGGLAI